MSELKVSGADGSGYYDIIINGVKISCNDVIDALDMNFNQGEAFKALWRMGRKPGVPKSYDADKVEYYAKREAKKVREQEARDSVASDQSALEVIDAFARDNKDPKFVGYWVDKTDTIRFVEEMNI